jgi:3-hydroxymyristoyl/3-hydroxydecanoyl-(acyl carrier protein) dehydratase
LNFVVRRIIPAAHPSLAGHFPGNPVVPGVVLLAEVLDALAAWIPEFRVAGFRTVKFLRPLPPDRSFTIVLEHAATATVRFHCHTATQPLCKGTITLRSGQDPV